MDGWKKRGLEKNNERIRDVKELEKKEVMSNYFLWYLAGLINKQEYIGCSKVYVERILLWRFSRYNFVQLIDSEPLELLISDY